MNYKIASHLATGTYTDVSLCEDGITLLKVIRDSTKSNLLEKEADIVTKLKDTNLAEFFPVLIDRTEVLGKQNCDDCIERFKCFTNVIDKDKNCKIKNKALVYSYDKEMPSLADVIKSYPDGIDERDMVWMYKRLLAAVWTAHSIGVVHSAVLPEHVFLNLKTHGILLIDWMHTNPVWGYGDKVWKPNIEKLGEGFYYPKYEITVDNMQALDIHMATICMITIMGGIDKVSKDIRLIMRAGTMGATDAKLMHEQLDLAVKRLFGPSVFRPFKLK